MFFWKIYSKFYSKLDDFFPYQELKHDVLSKILIDPKGLYLDVGCGVGLLICNHKNVIGVDISKTMIMQAKIRNPSSSFVRADLDVQLPFREHSFDGVYTNNVLAYLCSPAQTLYNLSRLLKPGGWCVVSTLRPSFNPFVLIWAHLRHGSLRLFFSNIFVAIFILVLNLEIVLKLRLNIYHGFESHALSHLMSSCGFEILETKKCYANQNILLIARRQKNHA